MARILTVDDSSTIRRLLGAVLRGQGHDVAEAEDGMAALDWLAAHDRPDLLITDVNMPRLDGLGLAEAVRAMDRHHDLPIIILSTEHSDDKQMRARRAGVSGWIVKPFEPAKLLRAVELVAA